MAPGFVHLHLHSEYSLVDSIVRIKPLVESVRQRGMPAVAVTERSNLFSMVKFYRAAMAAGVKPIIGVDMLMRDGTDASRPAPLLLLCQNQTGYAHLTRLISRTYTDGQHEGVPYLHPDWLNGATDGLIALGGINGDVGQSLLAGRGDVARRQLDKWRSLFPDRFYLELQRTEREQEENYLVAAVELAAASGTPVVATNAVRFLNEGDFEAHEARVCIHESRILADPRRRRRYSPKQYLRSAEEMCELFADLPEALANSVHIAARCNVELRLGENFLPDFPVPEGNTPDQWFRDEAHRGLSRRLGASHRQPADDPDSERKVYEQRLNLELDVITEMGFAGYFLIVADFIGWAKRNDIPVGPGRGSGAGSLVAYALEITDLDPIHYDLLFERFLNPERVSLPDFDIDFCMEGRDRVIDYVADRYGADRVSQIITFGTMAAKAVVRDVGRVLGYPFGLVDKLAKLIPFELGITLERALEDPALRARYDDEEDVRTILDLAMTLEGLVRNAGRHAGGVVIAPSALTDFTPLYCEQGASSVVTQLDKNDVEAVGLVKFDFLGLKTLTIIDWAMRSINAARAEQGEEAIDIERLPTDDEETMAFVRSAATTAVFQLESRLSKDLIRRLQPDRFEDIVALNALIRPGPQQSGMVEDFIERKNARAKVDYPHPDLEPVLRPTYGVTLYQEQVMQIAQVLAGYTLGGADLLRKAMGKKDPKEMAKQRAVFLEGASAKNVPEAVASSIFDVMEKFAGYGFNRAHSAAYAFIGYQTAWLKTHHPAAFMAAVLSADMDNTDKVVVFIDECRDLDLEVLAPDINACGYHFSAPDVKTVRYGLGAVKGVGRAAIEGIVAERDAHGPFTDLFDFCERLDTRRANRRVIEALVRAGALDALGPSRAALVATLSEALQTAEQAARDRSAGQDDMFGGAAAAPKREFVKAPDWSSEERLAGEKATLGLYLTGHPIARYESELAQFVSGRLSELRPIQGQNQVAAGWIVNLRTLNSRKGRMAIVTLDDRSARIEAVVYAEVFQNHRELLTKDRLLVVVGEVTADDFTGGSSMMAEKLHDLRGARELFARHLSIRVAEKSVSSGFIRQLADVMGRFRTGNIPVCVDYHRTDASVRLPLGDDWRVQPSDELLSRLRELAGEERVAVHY